MRLLLVGGGSVGHLAPCVAVWQAVKERVPDAQGHIVCGLREDETNFLGTLGIPFTALPVPRSWMRGITFLADVIEAKRLLRKIKPDLVFLKGGALSVPIAFAAKRRGIPIVVHESDALPGRATRFLRRWAAVTCTGFPSEGKGRDASALYTGNPVRPEITQGQRAEGLRITGLSGKRPILLVMGGSQGALALNRIVAAALPSLLQQCDIVHITGRGKEGAAPQPGYWSVPFAETGVFPHLYTIATVALSRCGAGGIGELAANGIPAILVPLTGVAQDHQRANALHAETSGGCVYVPQEKLAMALEALVRDFIEPTRREERSNCMRTLATPNAARHLADVLIKVFSKEKV